MTCKNCNAPLEDGARFCAECGTPVEATPVEATPAQPTPVQATPAQPTQSAPKKPRKPLSKKMIAIISGAAAAAIILVVVLAIVLNLNKTINLADYTKVTFEGYNTKGTATIDFDETKFLADLKEKGKNLDEDINENSSYSDILNALSNSSALSGIKNVEYELDKDSDLSNGDVVTVKFTFDNEKANKYGITYKGDDMTFTASGLKEIKEIDPFADITIKYEGTSPDASASIENNSSDEAVQNLYFQFSKSSGLAKGETFTVTVDVNEDDFMEQYGAKLSATSKDFTVDSVDSYITATADIPEALLTSIKNQTEDVVKAYAANNKDQISISGESYSGCYFLTEKSSDGWHDHNVLYCVYKATVKSKNKLFKKSTVYFPVRYRDLTLYADGTGYVDLNVDEISGSTGLSMGWYGVSGYLKVSTMKNELVIAQKGSYNEETIDTIQ